MPRKGNMMQAGTEIGNLPVRLGIRRPLAGASKALPSAATASGAESAAHDGVRPRPLGAASKSARAVLFAALLGGSAVEAAASEHVSGVVASILPVHALVEAVMADAGEPGLAINPAGDQHDFDLRPSIASMLESARLVFAVDETLEIGMLDAARTLAPDARIVILSDSPGFVRRPLREGGGFELDARHDHHGHGHEEHDEEEDGHEHDEDEHGHDEDGHEHEEDEHGHDEDGHEHEEDEHEHEEDEHGHDDEEHEGDGHDESEYEETGFDPHGWLDPVNATAMARMIASALAELDPAGAAGYERNAEDLARRLAELNEEIESELAPVRDLPFIVFHDAYRYFEDRYGLSAVGSAVLDPHHSPSARRILELRERIREFGVTCVIGEPNLNRRVIDTIVEGLGVRVGVVDPSGVTLDDGPDLYFELIRAMAAVFKDCLSPEG